MIIRPEGFQKETRDCTVRALSLVTNLPYASVHLAFQQAGRKDKHRFCIESSFQKVCKSLNLQAKQIKRSGSVKKLIRQYPAGRILCAIRGHCFALINGVTHDCNSESCHITGAWLITNNEAMKNDDYRF
jgi:hypothetical protein